jgi:SsrA-binding protein
MPAIAENKKAYFNHQILEKFEAGLSLTGQEVKSIKERSVNLAGSYVSLKKGEFFWVEATIPAYQPANAPGNYDSKRPRKLLLNREEIRYLVGKTSQKSLTLIPLKIYTKKGKIKLEFGIGRGKKTINKRELIKKRELDMRIKRELRMRG